MNLVNGKGGVSKCGERIDWDNQPKSWKNKAGFLLIPKPCNCFRLFV